MFEIEKVMIQCNMIIEATKPHKTTFTIHKITHQ